MKCLWSLLVFVLIPVFCFAQNEPYGTEWKRADSLLQSGFPESGSKIAQSIYDRAKQKGQQVQQLKAQIYLMGADFQRNEDAFRDAIAKAEQQAQSASFPNNAIWQSIAAQLYWNYYRQHRYNILERTKTSGNTEIADFEQWDANRFFEKATALYLASIAGANELEQIKIGQYDPVLIKGVHTRNLRPTLFDLLAFRALEYFENDEKDLTKPAFAFTMDDEKAFAPAKEFIQHRFASKDSSALQWQALRLYQRVLKQHQDDEDKDAFLDADLQRLEFAYNTSVRQDKKELYKTAQELLEQQYGNNPLSATAAVRIAQLMMPEAPARRGYVPPSATDRTPKNFPAIKEKLEAIIAKYPESEGGVLAAQLRQQILAKELRVITEEVVLPAEPSKMLIGYRNVSSASIRLIKLNNAGAKRIGSYYGNQEKQNAELLSLPYLRQWEVSLPATGDYDSHSMEVKIDALGSGTYAAVISGKPDFGTDNNLLSYAVFQVSRLSAVQNNEQGIALDRKTGVPLQGAAIDFFRQRYNDNIRGYELVKAATVSADPSGVFTYKTDNEPYTAIRIRLGKDSVMLPGYYHTYRNQQETKPQSQTFFFTDRSIYRPGQTIFFKGIMLRKEESGKKTFVLSGEETEVSFYDVNGQKLSSKKFTTNDFGSFSGSFLAPEGMLNGNMRIGNGSGEVDFSVEEYKRPKFYVSFDTLQTAYALNETVKVGGKAIAYAGNALDNATVKYRVVRNARFPYWWYAYRWGFPRSPEMEIVSGLAQTDKDGNFAVVFKATPDLSVDPRSLPVFSYTVTADVTDLNGETRSGSTAIHIGYTALQLAVDVPEYSRPEVLDTISISSLNLNGQFVASDIRLRISLLRAPQRVLRKRLWPVPDQFMMDSVSFKKDFPDDVYRDEDDHLKWSVADTRLERSIRTTKEGGVPIPKDTWKKNGWYVIELTATDRSGKELTEKKYVQVWSPDNEGSTSEALTVLPQAQAAEPGQTAKVYALSGYGQAHFVRQVQDMSNRTSLAQIDYQGDPVAWSRRIEEADRGGLMVSYIMVKENRFYTQQVSVKVSWSNKDLKIGWETHRDKLQPGDKETWTMVVSGNKKEKLAAEMVATLYDASLDAFRQHGWQVYVLFPSLTASGNWNGLGFGQSNGRPVSYLRQPNDRYFEKRYDLLTTPFEGFYESQSRTMFSPQALKSGGTIQFKTGNEITLQDATAANSAPPFPDLKPKPTQEAKNDVIQPRKNLQETAFFFPQLRTDASGNIRMEFTMPEALTEWRLLAFAHTKDMSNGLLQGTVKTQKDLMVMPGLPRFFRQGDEISISAKISNLSDKDLSGTATLELLNAATGQAVDLPFRLVQKKQRFSAAKGQSTTASWKLHVPESMYEPVIVRVQARSGNFTDGEENILPVITNRMLVTETLPLWINGDGTKDFSFDKLKHSDTSRTLAQHSLTLEYTGNPAWYAVQSLPYLMEYPYECAEQVFNRYYATALAAHIVAQSPRIKAVFDKWKTESLLSSFISPLEQNQELKSALLQETPWVMEAKNESEQRRRLGQLFDTYKLSKELETALRKLKDMQLPEGGFPWFKGMSSDRFITQYIITGLGRLQKLGVRIGAADREAIVAKALPYLDGKLKEGYDQLVKNKAKLEDQHLGYSEVQYLYLRSFFDREIVASGKTAVNYYRSQAAKYWAQFNPYMKGMIALALSRGGDKETPKGIIQSLKETAIRKEEMGMYWMQPGYSYWWYEAPIEAQSLLIECFKEMAKDNASVDAMKLWLLKNKQTQSWATTKATADACYALLLSGTDWLSNTPEVTVRLGARTIENTEQQKEAGSGYFKLSVEGKDVRAEMGSIQLSVRGNGNNTSWGAVYWQYFEDLDKISSARTPLEIKKQLFLERNTERGPELQPITSANVIRVGDKVKIRIEILVDRDMEYVQLKDMRAAAFEPVNVISAYKWQSGLGYYESTKDVSTSFFFDHLNKGKYVFEYPVFVSQAGDFSNGLATIQCMYAPEFSSHSEGIRVKVEAAE